MSNLLITGANGYIGSALALELTLATNHIVRASVRKKTIKLPSQIQVIENMEVSDNTNWTDTLQDIDVIIHCAAHVHVMKEKSQNSILEFKKINTDGTLNLARQAASLGVKRFIFLSTIGVNGAETINHPFKADDIAKPYSPYSKSKLEAEIGLKKISEETNMAIVIIRPPLVYGPNAPGNFSTLLRFMKWRMPLPLGAINNKRSFIFLGNLVDLIIRCIEHPNAENQIFLVSDDHDISTTQLLQNVRKALKKFTLLLPIPMNILSLIAKYSGNERVAQQLLGSLEIDIKKTKLLLGWKPPFNIFEALEKTVGR
jgi:nucleoside-diphosphate-sugar epimerase